MVIDKYQTLDTFKPMTQTAGDEISNHNDDQNMHCNLYCAGYCAGAMASVPFTYQAYCMVEES